MTKSERQFLFQRQASRLPRRPRESTEKHFICPFCGLSYYYKKHLKFHLRQKHSFWSHPSVALTFQVSFKSLAINVRAFSTFFGRAFVAICCGVSRWTCDVSPVFCFELSPWWQCSAAVFEMQIAHLLWIFTNYAPLISIHFLFISKVLCEHEIILFNIVCCFQLDGLWEIVIFSMSFQYWMIFDRDWRYLTNYISKCNFLQQIISLHDYGSCRLWLGSGPGMFFLVWRCFF